MSGWSMECMLKKTIGFLIGFLLLCPWVTEGKAAELDELMAKISFSKLGEVSYPVKTAVRQTASHA